MRTVVQWHTNRYLVVVLILSILLRVAVALYLGDEVDAPPLLTDRRSYRSLGARLVAGHGFSFEPNWYPFTLANVPTAHWSFLYSLLVAGVYALCGLHPPAVRAVQTVLGGLLLSMVYRLARRLFPAFPEREGRRVGSKILSLVAAAVGPVLGAIDVPVFAVVGLGRSATVGVLRALALAGVPLVPCLPVDAVLMPFAALGLVEWLPDASRLSCRERATLARAGPCRTVSTGNMLMGLGSVITRCMCALWRI